MKRKITDSIKEWIESDGRKPLILRGARQVGKTWAVRNVAKEVGFDLIEINFERNPEYEEIFLGQNIKDVVTRLEVIEGRDINVEKSLLFLDEIQACPAVLSRLRWMYEELPALAVVCAGSLLEFALDELDFSMPVGRITYMYMGPMSFIEFLWASGEEKLAELIIAESENLKMPRILHDKAMELFRQYCVIGGMPAIVEAWIKSHSISDCINLQTDLITTYRDDFNKYRKRLSPDVLRYTMNSVSLQLGQKFMYSRVQNDMKYAQIKEALSMLIKAGLCRKVSHTAANGIPLGAEIKQGIFKIVPLDIGLSLNMLGLNPIDMAQLEKTVWANKGAVAEAVVGQLLLAGYYPHNKELYFWQQSGSGTGEIDYLIQAAGNSDIIPIEVKAGSSGSMKSLHAFMENKQLKVAYRFDTNPPSVQDLDIKTNAGKPVSYKLISLPLYMAEILTSRHKM